MIHLSKILKQILMQNISNLIIKVQIQVNQQIVLLSIKITTVITIMIYLIQILQEFQTQSA